MNLRHIKFFVSGAYTAETEQDKQRNIDTAIEKATALWEMGFNVYCPHTNTKDFEHFCKETKYEDFLEGCLYEIPTCDAIFMLPNWRLSNGAQEELQKAQKHELLEFYTLEEVKAYDWENYINVMDYLMNCFHEELRQVARVWAGNGRTKHGDFTEEPDFYATNIGKLLTHLGERMKKIMMDTDSKEPKMAHVVCRALKIMKKDNEKEE